MNSHQPLLEWKIEESSVNLTGDRSLRLSGWGTWGRGTWGTWVDNLECSWHSLGMVITS
ncbi:MAG: hypothetical protein ACRC8A_15595 [Microcoleaceae cyanobacterium]